MATNFNNTNVKQTVVERFFEGLFSVSEQWAQAYDYRRNDIADLRISPITGVSSIPNWNGGDLPVQELEALTPQLVQYEKFGLQVRVDKYDAKDVPESTTTLPQRIGVATASTYAAKAAEVLAGAFSTSTTSVDGLALCATNHVTKIGTRSNKLTTGLDSAAIMAAIAMFRRWRDYQGLPRDVVAEGGFYLIIPPDLEEAAGQALGSSVTSDQMQVNMAGSYGIDTIVWNHLTDADNWFLVSKAGSPLIFWERSAPDLQVQIDEDSKAGKYSLDFAISSAVSALPDGIVGSEV
jgi:hypothetical protein